MRPSNLLIIVSMALLSACATASQEATADTTAAPKQIVAEPTPTNADVKDSTSTVLKPQAGSYSPECYKVITDIVMSSSFKTEAAKKENIKVRIDREEGSKLFLQLFASEKDHESTLAWLRLDKANEKLEDITVDPASPVLLKYNNALISELRQNCP
ncbi:hypothetical protein [Chitinophaga silvisoli]|uniref:Lipoprotein n=1 Tax=Chitinophaga silvisoli TaxID=2291814 RepID=A0A3E1P2P8_9BACT|nr:hypothetical protein [Chitinophaga silvisoli]RFM34483.1 hypothetical protein DXN04_14500 [Chitinophaga silvisoli]